MRRAVIIDTVRSPFGRGRAGGALDGIHPVDLYADVLRGLVERTGIAPALVEDVITGCVIQVGEQSGNIGRHAVLASGLPESVPAITLDRKCGSAQQAFDFAAQGVMAGAYDVVIAGGVEMMSLVPMRANRLGKDTDGVQLKRRYPDGLVRQGISAELIAARWNISRAEMDAFSLRSHTRAATAEDAGLTARAIVPVDVPTANGEMRQVTRDEGLRRDTSLERLASLKPAFEDDAMLQRYPQICWSVTAGNSSQVTDGASATLIMEETLATQLGLKPRAAITHFAVAGDDPILMLTAIIPATRKLLARAGLGVEDISVFEVNEAFASVPLAWQKDLGVDPERVNPYGGAIALGHPVGASGGRLLANLLTVLEETDGRYGLQTMCESGGMANATLIERLH
ncbi:thiolase family protein [Sphingosinicella microcystinivorans]|uniref:thiolase family protein n=1 Tax=Sphingosinicella microcystinivorans TaxID=335406 RepID=UPI0022F3B526|nr:thiolase family protein [Sphingosinicella microcystinivorans]WBX85786.1 thiolase family protein [Sphingosinicella microcystinivorans]